MTSCPRCSEEQVLFYRLFTYVDVFTQLLIRHHLKRTKIIAERERLCNTINPDLIDLLLSVKQDLLFNRQLRVNRHIPAFKTCFEQSNKEIEDTFLTVWAQDIGLTDKPELADSLVKFALESFYLQLTDATLTRDWLLNYFSEQATGKTATKIIRERSILEAMRLLTFTDQTVAEGAAHLGYYDSCYFAKLFRAKVGLSPTDFKTSGGACVCSGDTG